MQFISHLDNEATYGIMMMCYCIPNGSPLMISWGWIVQNLIKIIQKVV